MDNSKEKPPLIRSGICLDDVREIEETYLVGRRLSAGVESPSTISLALSGGGVRAACFALGVIHWMERSGHWKKVDYISSVSGGGYAASGVLAVSRNPRSKAAGATLAETVLTELNRDDDGYIKLSMLSVMTMFLLLAVSSLLSLSPVLLLVGQSGPLVMNLFPSHHAYDRYSTGIIGALCAVIGVCQRLLARWRRRSSRDGHVLFFLAMIFGAVQTAYWAGHPYPTQQGMAQWSDASFLGTSIVAGVIWVFVVAVFCLRPSHPNIARLHGRARYALGFTFLLSAGLLIESAMRNLAQHDIAVKLNMLYVASLVVAFIAMGANPNRFCLPLKIYYDGLRRKFGQGRDEPMHEARDAGAQPIHLINCFSQSPVSPDNERKQRRGGENFSVSRHFCGMPSTGYFETKEWYLGRRSKSWEHQFTWRLTATSGAAVDIHPVKQSPLWNSLLSVINMGLGTWVINPACALDRRTWRPSFFLNFRAALSVHNNATKWIRLSDGGHFENLGVYELVGRACMNIVVVDAGHDPNFRFADLAHAIERCREDFEAEIDVPGLFPGATGAHNQELILTGTIRYKGKSKLGKLTYIKLGVRDWHSLPLRLRPSIDPHFPHEPTSNQFPTRDFINSYFKLGEETAARAMPAERKETEGVPLATA
jgi:hypothetical protein